VIVRRGWIRGHRAGMGMVCREVRGEVPDRAVRGPSRGSIGQPARRTPVFSDHPLDTGNPAESNACSGGPGKVADGEVNAHLGNPDRAFGPAPSSYRRWAGRRRSQAPGIDARGTGGAPC
jgi:hypothetical protein